MVKKKDQLLVEFTLPKEIPLQALWYLGLGSAKTAVVALNIGTTGFFWWYAPDHASRYYERLVDLETGMLVGVERSPQVRLCARKARKPLKTRDISKCCA